MPPIVTRFARPVVSDGTISRLEKDLGKVEAWLSTNCYAHDMHRLY